MIQSFKSKRLKELFEEDSTSKIDPKLQESIKEILDLLHQATTPRDMNIPGYDFHGLHGKPKRFSVHVNGPWCITFEFVGSDAYRVDFEQYH